ncbi:MAG: hypothetical protein H6581_05850 [Bacteroidia bacterium]|nr:hypothetical protein [Bacteroidia bacterium]
MKSWILSKDHKIYLALGLLGAVGGVIYWNFSGCTQGCPIDSSPWWSLARGSAIGLSLAGIGLSFRSKRDSKKNEDEN